MTPNRHPSPHDLRQRERELDRWLEHAMGRDVPDIEPVVHDLDD